MSGANPYDYKIDKIENEENNPFRASNKSQCSEKTYLQDPLQWSAIHNCVHKQMNNSTGVIEFLDMIIQIIYKW